MNKREYAIVIRHSYYVNDVLDSETTFTDYYVSFESALHEFVINAQHYSDITRDHRIDVELLRTEDNFVQCSATFYC